MRLAIVAPLIEPVPPPLYGGTERVVSVLTEELVRRGYDVTLFASGDSRTTARLIPCSERGLRLDPAIKDYVAYTVLELGRVYACAHQFDLIHNHTDYLAFPFARLASTPTVTTTHGRLDLPEVQRLYQEFPEQRLISISNAQRTPLPKARWIATVYNAIDIISGLIQEIISCFSAGSAPRNVQTELSRSPATSACAWSSPRKLTLLTAPISKRSSRR